MEFALFQWVGGSVDAMLNTFVTETAANIILGFQLVIRKRSTAPPCQAPSYAMAGALIGSNSSIRL